MITFADRDPNARLYALYGALFLMLLMPIGLLGTRAGAFDLKFYFVPLIAIFLWPRLSDEALSAVIICLLGLVFDLLHGSRIGQSAVMFLVYYGAVNPKARPSKRPFLPSWGWFALTILAVAFVFQIVGFAQTQIILSGSIVLMAISAVVLFPVIFLGWGYVRRLMSEIDEF